MGLSRHEVFPWTKGIPPGYYTYTTQILHTLHPGYTVHRGYTTLRLVTALSLTRDEVSVPRYVSSPGGPSWIIAPRNTPRSSEWTPPINRPDSQKEAETADLMTRKAERNRS